MALRRAVGETRADAGLPQRPHDRARRYSRLRMLWHQSCTMVMPELIASAAASRVPWYMSSGVVIPAPRARDGAEIAVLRLVARHAAQQRVPHVPVGLDQARQHDHAGAVDGLRRPVRLSFRPTATISPSRTCTSPPAMSPASVSMVIT